MFFINCAVEFKTEKNNLKGNQRSEKPINRLFEKKKRSFNQ